MDSVNLTHLKKISQNWLNLWGFWETGRLLALVFLLLTTGISFTKGQDISSDLVLKLDFDRNFSDSSGNNYHPSAPSSYWGIKPSFARDRINRQYTAGYFDGSQCLEYPDNSTMASNFNITDYTLAMWIKTTATRNQWIWVKGYTSTRYQINISATGAFGITYVGTVNENVVSSSGYNDGEWHFVVWRRSGTTTTITVDGVTDVTATGTITSNNTGNGLFTIGRYPTSTGDYFLGLMDDIRFYSRALTDQEIEVLRTLPAPVQNYTNPVSDGLFAKYDFNQNALDEGGNGYHGTVAGPSLTTDRFNIPNSAYLFGGKITSTFAFPSANELSFSVWFMPATNFNSSTLTDVIIEKTGQLLVYYHQGYLYFGGSSKQIDFAANTWHHIAGVFFNNGQIEWYLDDELILGTISGGIPTASAQLVIGNSPVYPQNGFYGKIDDLRFYSRALRPDEIDSLYNEVKTNNFPVKTKPVINLSLAEDASNYALADLDTIYSDPEMATLLVTAASSNNALNFTVAGGNILHVTSATDYYGTDSVFLEIGDGFNVIYDTLSVEVNSVNDAPAFNLSQSESVVDYLFSGSQVLTLVDTVLQPLNESTQTISYSISPETVDFADFAFNTSNGAFTLNSVEGYSASQVFTITANDGQNTNNTYQRQFLFEVQSIEIDTLLFAHYEFNGNAVDRTGKNSTLGMYYGNTPITVADHHNQAGGAYFFNYGIMRISNFNSTYVEDGFSVSFWLNPQSDMNESSARRTIYDHKGNTSYLYYQAGKLYLLLNTSNIVYSLDTNFVGGQWYHLAITVKQNGRVTFYINNQAFDAGGAPATLNEAIQSFYVGGTMMPATQTAGEYLNATIDDLRFYGRAINPHEVDSLYNFPEQVFQSLALSICPGDTLIKAGNQFFTAGTFKYTEPGNHTPDTLVTLTLSFYIKPNVSIDASSEKVCEGAEIKLTAEGANSYNWDNGVVNGVDFPIFETKVFTVIGTDTNGCRDTASISIEVLTNQIVDEPVSAEQTSFCGENFVETTISIDSSIVGYNYYLRNDATNSLIDGPISGTGTGIVFNTGTMTENTSFNVYAESFPGATHGLDFDGINEKVTIPYSTSLDMTDAFTIEAWVFPRSGNYDRYIGNYSGTGNTPGDIVFDGGTPLNNGKGIRLYLVKQNGTPVSIPAENVVKLNEWNHIAAVFNNGVIKLIANGVLVATGNFGATTLPVNTANWVLGEDNGGSNPEFLNGKMDEVRLWNISRTESQIQKTMNTCLSGNEEGLLAYYKFDETSGTVLTDATPNHNNGVLINMENDDWKEGAISCDTKCSLEMTDKVNITLGFPNIIASDDVTINYGDSAYISVSGGISYQWNQGLGSNDAYWVKPLETTTYIVSGTDGVCDKTDSVTVFVNSVPLLIHPISDIFILEDEALQLEMHLDTVFMESSGGQLGFSYESSSEAIGIEIVESLLKLTIDPDFFGSVTITVTAENANAAITDTFAMNVEAVNDAPELLIEPQYIKAPLNFSQILEMNSTVTQPVNESNQQLSFTLIPASVSFAAVMVDTTGKVTFTAVKDSTGIQEFTLVVSDNQMHNNTDTAHFILEIHSIDPVALVQSFDNQAFDEDMVTLSISNLNPYFTKPMGYSLSFTATTDNQFIIPEISDSTLNILVNEKNYYGSAIITVTATNGYSNAQGSFSVVINPVNDAPTSYSGTITGNEDEILVFKPADFDFTDVDGDSLVYIKFETIPSDTKLFKDENLNNLLDDGERMVNGTEFSVDVFYAGIIKYKPDTNLFSNSLGGFDIKVSDGLEYSADNYFYNLDIHPVNDAPIFTVSDTLLYLGKNFSGVRTLTTENLQPENENNQSITYTLQPETTSFVGVAFNTATGQIDFSSIPDAFGTQLFTLTANDGEADNNLYEKNFTVSVLENLPPEIVQSINDTMFYEDAGTVLLHTDLSMVFSDPENETLTFTALSSNDTNVSVSITGTQLFATLSDNFYGDAEISVGASDGVSTIFEKFNIQVNSVNDAPAFQLNQTAVVLIQDFTSTETIVVLPDSVPENESDQVVTYQLNPSGVSFANVSFNNSTGEVTINAVTGGTGSQVFEIVANDGQNENNVWSQTFTLTINRNNLAPSDILLSNQQITENNATGEVIGIFTTTDADDTGGFVYSLVSGDGDTDNGLFFISGINAKSGIGLFTNSTFNFEQQSIFSIRVQTTDPMGASFEEVFNISVIDANDSPSAIVLTNISLVENSPLGTVVGSFVVTDEDASDSHSLSFFFNGEFNGDNGSFVIDGMNLKLNTNVDFETKQEYIIFVEATDLQGAKMVSQINILVTDVNETGVSQQSQSVFNIYPNPSQGRVVISNIEKAGQQAEITLMQVNGFVLMQETMQIQENTSIVFDNQPSGVYLLRVIMGNQVYYHTLVKK